MLLLIEKEEAGNNCANQREMILVKRGSFFLNNVVSRKMGNMGIWGKTKYAILLVRNGVDNVN